MLGAATMEVIDRFWTGQVGPLLGSTGAARTVVRAMPTRPDGSEGVGLFLRENLLIVSIPESRVTALRQVADGWSAADVWHPERVGRDLRLDRAALIGPAYLGYTEAGRFRPVPAQAARVLIPNDAGVVEELKRECDPTEWDHGGCEPCEERPAIGVFEDGRLAALAGYEVWGGTIAHLYIIAHPACRGRGRGRQAMSELTQLVLGRGLVAQCRTLEANGRAIAIAGALGFERYATTVWCRLKP